MKKRLALFFFSLVIASQLLIFQAKASQNLLKIEKLWVSSYKNGLLVYPIYRSFPYQLLTLALKEGFPAEEKIEVKVYLQKKSESPVFQLVERVKLFYNSTENLYVYQKSSLSEVVSKKFEHAEKLLIYFFNHQETSIPLKALEQKTILIEEKVCLNFKTHFKENLRRSESLIFYKLCDIKASHFSL